MALDKARIDLLLVERGLAKDQKEAHALIMAGRVLVNSDRIDKPGIMIPKGSNISLKGGKEYVGRGALKLEGAIDNFSVKVSNKVCVDVGACTGGFTEILLKHGAKRVYAIDVAYGELDWKLRQDTRVVNMERTNVRTLNQMPEPIDLVTIDLSFISLTKVIPVIANWLKPDAQIIALIKPQFEAARHDVAEGGVILDPSIHRKVVSEFLYWATKERFGVHGLMLSPIEGLSGNREFLALLDRANKSNKEREEMLHELFGSKE